MAVVDHYAHDGKGRDMLPGAISYLLKEKQCRDVLTQDEEEVITTAGMI